jgi:hypothetical protein
LTGKLGSGIGQSPRIPASAGDAISLPLYIFQTKSAGYRIVLFCEEYIAAGTMRKTIQAVRKSLGLPNKVHGKDPIEIYPKQETTSGKGNANAMELPYCGMKYEGSIETFVVTGHGNLQFLDVFPATVEKPPLPKSRASLLNAIMGKEMRATHVISTCLSTSCRMKRANY